MGAPCVLTAAIGPRQAGGNFITTGSPLNPAAGGVEGIRNFQYVPLAFPSTSRGDQYNGRLDYTIGRNLFAYSSYFTTVNNVTPDNAGRDRPHGYLSIQPVTQTQPFSFVRTYSPTLTNEFPRTLPRFTFN